MINILSNIDNDGYRTNLLFSLKLDLIERNLVLNSNFSNLL